jgi:hypothetical protein
LRLPIHSHTILVSRASHHRRRATSTRHRYRAPNFLPTLPTLVAMGTSTPPKAKTVDKQITDLRMVIDNMAASMATMQGNQGQLTVAVNQLQSEKIVVGDDRNPQTSRDPIISTARHVHKLLFPTYDGTEDPLPWLNRCE